MSERQKRDMMERFDAEALDKLKHDFNGYRYCPRCREELDRQEIDGHLRLSCSAESCDFIFYHNPVPAAGVLIYNPDEGILLVKRAHPPCVGWWCLPAGYMEWHESPIQTAIRETREETGLLVEITQLFNIYSGSDDPRTNAVLALYHASIVGGELKAGDDAMDARYFPLDELPELVAFEAHRTALREFSELLSKQ